MMQDGFLDPLKYGLVIIQKRHEMAVEGGRLEVIGLYKDSPVWLRRQRAYVFDDAPILLIFISVFDP